MPKTIKKYYPNDNIICDHIKWQNKLTKPINQTIRQTGLVVSGPESLLAVDGEDGDVWRGRRVAVHERPEVGRRLVAVAPLKPVTQKRISLTKQN